MENNVLNLLEKQNLEIIEVLDNNFDRCYVTILGRLFNKEKNVEEKIVLKFTFQIFVLSNINIF